MHVFPLDSRQCNNPRLPIHWAERNLPKSLARNDCPNLLKKTHHLCRRPQKWRFSAFCGPRKHFLWSLPRRSFYGTWIPKTKVAIEIRTDVIWSWGGVAIGRKCTCRILNHFRFCLRHSGVLHTITWMDSVKRRHIDKCIVSGAAAYLACASVRSIIYGASNLHTRVHFITTSGLIEGV